MEMHPINHPDGRVMRWAGSTPALAAKNASDVLGVECGEFRIDPFQPESAEGVCTPGWSMAAASLLIANVLVAATIFGVVVWPAL